MSLNPAVGAKASKAEQNRRMSVQLQQAGSSGASSAGGKVQNKAKTNTLSRNKEQWGITEALKGSPGAAAAAAGDSNPAMATAGKASKEEKARRMAVQAEQGGGATSAPAAAPASGGKAQNKAKTNTLSRNKEQWGITEALKGSPGAPAAAAAAPAAPAAPAASGGKAQNKAKANTLSRNKEQWGITEALKGSPGAAAPAAAAAAAPAPVVNKEDSAKIAKVGAFTLPTPYLLASGSTSNEQTHFHLDVTSQKYLCAWP